MRIEDIVQLILSGLVTGAVYTIIGLGYNVVYSATNVFNMAQGELLMLGMMTGVLFFVTLSWPVLVAVALVMLFVGAVSVLGDQLSVRPVARSATSLTWILSTIAFALIIRNVAVLIWGSEPLPFRQILPVEPIRFLGLRLAPQGLLVIVSAIHGKALVALAQDREAAELRGIDFRRMSTLAFLIGGAIAGFGGFILAPLTLPSVAVGELYTFKGFIACAIGGLGNNKGTVFGGFALGVIELFGAQIVGNNYRTTAAIAVLIAILLIKPTGLFGQRALRQV